MAGPTVTYRPAEPADLRPAFAIFRRSIMDFAHRRGIVASPEVTPAMLDEGWLLRGGFIEHLWTTAAENWIAEDGFGAPIGWAMSVERGGMLELTHFFVDPAAQSKGVGRGLLDRAFPAGRAAQRSILATQDPRAMSLYLRSGVRHVATVMDFEAAPRPVEVETDLELEVAGPGPDSIEAIAAIEAQVLGHRREVDTAFLLGLRPAWLARRGGRVVGFAFGCREELTGPIGALEATDIPALLAHVETAAAAAGETNVYFSTPLANDAAVGHLLERGFQLDPFVVAVLADDRSMQLDRWIHTGLSYIL
jgi:GNAT superfamily N-acetyltransferase